jgi:hypothetical protein
MKIRLCLDCQERTARPHTFLCYHCEQREQQADIEALELQRSIESTPLYEVIQDTPAVQERYR